MTRSVENRKVSDVQLPPRPTRRRGYIFLSAPISPSWTIGLRASSAAATHAAPILTLLQRQLSVFISYLPPINPSVILPNPFFGVNYPPESFRGHSVWRFGFEISLTNIKYPLQSLTLWHAFSLHRALSIIAANLISLLLAKSLHSCSKSIREGREILLWFICLSSSQWKKEDALF